MSLDLTQNATALASSLIEPFNRRDFDGLLALGGGRVDYTDVALGQHITDADVFKATMQGWVTAFSDLRATVTSAAHDGNLLAYEVRFEGTHDGPLETPMGTIPASGRRITTYAVHVAELDGDQVAAVRDYADVLSLLSQVGAIPAQPQGAESAATSSSAG